MTPTYRLFGVADAKPVTNLPHRGPKPPVPGRDESKRR